MPKFYCLNCGFGTDYTLHKPKVCLKCNYSFVQPIFANRSVQSPVQQSVLPKIIVEKPVINDVDVSFKEEDEHYITEIPTSQRLSFAHIEAERNCASITGNQIIQKAKETKLEQNKPKRGRAKKS